MKILVTGAKEFAGRNLCCNLLSIAEGKNRPRSDLHSEEIYEYDLDSMSEQMNTSCPVSDAIEDNVSTKAVRIIQFYIGVINKMVSGKS